MPCQADRRVDLGVSAGRSIAVEQQVADGDLPAEIDVRKDRLRQQRGLQRLPRLQMEEVDVAAAQLGRSPLECQATRSPGPVGISYGIDPMGSAYFPNSSRMSGLHSRRSSRHFPRCKARRVSESLTV